MTLSYTIKPASLFTRFTAAVIDVITLSSIMIFTLSILMHFLYFDVFTEFYSITNNSVIGQGGSHQLELLINSLPSYTNSLVVLIINIQLMFLFIYFLCSEYFLKGRTVGKQILGLRTVQTKNLLPPTCFQCIIRSTIKTFAIAVISPIPLLIFDSLLALITKRCQSGHDILSNTMVVNSSKLNKI